MTNPDRAIELSGSLGIRDAGAILERLQGALAGAHSLIIDCTALTGADLSIVQLLVSARASAAAEGKTIRLKAPAGGALDQLLRQTGFLGADGKPLAPHDDFWTGAPHSEAA